MARRAVFLDRDGTVITEKGYLSDPGAVELIPGSAEALARLREAGFLLVVVTNQSGVARGFFGEDEVRGVHAALDSMLAKAGASIDAYYVCPHHPDHGDLRECTCRKPATGLAEQAAGEFDIDMAGSYFVGDKASDVELGINAGGRSVLVLTGYGMEQKDVLEQRGVRPDMVCPTLSEAADWIIQDSKGSL